MSTLIMKFGGSAVGTVAALAQVISIVLHEHKRWDQLVLVVSAMDGITDMLIEAASLAQVANQRGYRRIAANLRTRHLAQVEQLPLGAEERSALQADIDRLLFEMLDECQHVASVPSDGLSAEVSDRIIGVGERLSARIIAALLRQNNLRSVAIDGGDIIITNDDFGNASPLMDLTCEQINTNLVPMLSRDIVPVVTGFIGRTLEGKPTTIGRGGSDYTASVIAVCTGAKEVWLWSDVDGIMSADPRDVPEARTLKAISYTEAAELAYFGARILHSRMMRPLQDHQIPLLVKNVFKPQQAGSRIHNESASPPDLITSITSIPALALTADRSGSVVEIQQIVDETYLAAIGSPAEVSISAQSSLRSFLCYIVPTSAGGMETVENIRLLLVDTLEQSPETSMWNVHTVSIITAVGDSLTRTTSIMRDVFNILDGIHIMGVAQGPSGTSMSIIVEMADADEALRAIHNLTLRSD